MQKPMSGSANESSEGSARAHSSSATNPHPPTQQSSMSPFLTPVLMAQTLKVKAMIENGEVLVPPRTCPGVEKRYALTTEPPPPTVVVQEDGTKLYFVPVCVLHIDTDDPICALYCLNIHRVFLREEQQEGVVDMSPTALEVLGGKEFNRKWRVSLRVLETRTKEEKDAKDGDDEEGEGDVVAVRMGLGKWLQIVGLEALLPSEAVSRIGSRVGSKQASRNATPQGSPSKRQRGANNNKELATSERSDASDSTEDAIAHAFARQARIVSSGIPLWEFFCGKLPKEGPEDVETVTRKLEEDVPNVLHPAGSDDDALIYLPSLDRLPSS